MKRSITISVLGLLVLAGGLSLPHAAAAEPEKSGRWLVTQEEHTGLQVYTRELTLHPKAEPVPALKYRMIPDDFDLVDGNAAIFYLKAMGFLEASSARRELFKFDDRMIERMHQDKKRGRGEVPPYSWLDMEPNEIPLDEVKDYLSLLSFQLPFLREARMRRHFEMDRNIREVDNPMAYLLPDIQSMRELARMRTLRCKVAIAEGRVDDAIDIVAQQYTHGWHLGQDEFLVSNLVGIAIAGIGWDDALDLVQHPDAPNLYWAFASMPRPLVDTRRSMAFERQLLYTQFKVLAEVDETPRPAGYWHDFIDRLMAQFGGFEEEFGLPWASRHDPETTRAMLVAGIAAAYPGAKQFLIDECGLAREQVEAYPTAQVVFLAVVRYYDQARDDQFKWTYSPYWHPGSKTRRGGSEELMRVDPDRVGWAATPARSLLPAVMAVQTAAARCEQNVAMMQTVEAIRMYGEANGGRLPATLDELPVPAPIDPFTGKPLDYRVHGRRAILTGHEMPGIRYRLVLQFAAKE